VSPEQQDLQVRRVLTVSPEQQDLQVRRVLTVSPVRPDLQVVPALMARLELPDLPVRRAQQDPPEPLALTAPPVLHRLSLDLRAPLVHLARLDRLVHPALLEQMARQALLVPPARPGRPARHLTGEASIRGAPPTR